MIGPFGMTVKSTMRERALPLAQALAQRGHTLTLLIPPWDSPEDAGQSSIDEGVSVINVALPRSKGLFFHWALTQTLVKQARQCSPDVIYFFKPKAYAGFAHMIFFYLRRLKFISARLIVDEDDWEIAVDTLNVGAWDPAFLYEEDQNKLYLYWGSSNEYPLLGTEIQMHNLKTTGITRPIMRLHPNEHGWERSKGAKPTNTPKDRHTCIKQKDQK